MYWYPLYVYIRGSGHSPHDAQDLTQEFFARLLEQDWLRVVDPSKGRFRYFLLAALKRFLTNEWHRSSAQKRGHGREPLSLNAEEAEHRFCTEPPLTPDQLYERRWAMTLLSETLARLECEYASTGRGAEFGLLKEWLTADRGTLPYPSIAKALEISEGAARVAVHRLRKRYRVLFREAVAETVEPDAVDDELRHIVSVLSHA